MSTLTKVTNNLTEKIELKDSFSILVNKNEIIKLITDETSDLSTIGLYFVIKCISKNIFGDLNISVNNLRSLINCSADRIHNHLNKLIELNIVEKEETRKNGKFCSNNYIIK